MHAVADSVDDGDADVDTLCEPLSVVDTVGVADTLALGDGEGESECVALPQPVEVTVLDGELETVCVLHSVEDGDTLAEDEEDTD